MPPGRTPAVLRQPEFASRLTNDGLLRTRQAVAFGFVTWDDAKCQLSKNLSHNWYSHNRKFDAFVRQGEEWPPLDTQESRPPIRTWRCNSMHCAGPELIAYFAIRASPVR